MNAIPSHLEELLAKARANVAERSTLQSNADASGSDSGRTKSEVESEVEIAPSVNINTNTHTTGENSEQHNEQHSTDDTNWNFTAEQLAVSSNLRLDSHTQSAYLSSSESTTESELHISAEQSRQVLSNGKQQSEAEAITSPAITLNPEQQAFADLAFTGEDCVLIGAAGTGKTTSQRESLTKLLRTPGRIKKMQYGTRNLKAGTPGIVIVSFTRKACNNIRRVVPEELKANVLTIHALLEYAPVFYEIDDAKTGETKKTMRFEPRRNEMNPLPEDIQCIVYEESSMIGCDLYNLLHKALQHPVQEIFLGDIQQLPPVFGPAVLGFKMEQLGKLGHVIELKRVYRQSGGSPILDTLWKILEGNPHAFSSAIEHYDPDTGQPTKINPKSRVRVPALDELSKETEFGTLKFQVWQKNLGIEKAIHTTIAQFKVWEQNGYYNPERDIILCPFNKQFGTVELNRGISNYLSIKRGALVYEIIAGFNKHYLAIGDRVLYDKEDAFIVDIKHNPAYLGKPPIPPSVELDRYGVYQRALTQEEMLQAKVEQEAAELAAAEHLFDDVSVDDIDERVNAASHEVVIRIAYSDEQITLKTSGEINALLGGYVITVHKFQGSEEDNVFVVFHASHSVMLERELIYTALSRGKKRVHVICENNTFEKAIKRQAIKGNTLEEKAQFFKGKQTKGNDYVVPVANEGLPEEEVEHWKSVLSQQSLAQSESDMEQSNQTETTGSSNSQTQHPDARTGTELVKSGNVLAGAQHTEDQRVTDNNQRTENPAEKAARILAEIRARKAGK